jgi:hypothetical protein
MFGLSLPSLHRADERLPVHCGLPQSARMPIAKIVRARAAAGAVP